MKRSEVYDQAAQQVAQGWQQNAVGNWNAPEGHVCAFGSILRVLGQGHRVGSFEDTGDLWERAEVLADALLPLANEGWESGSITPCSCSQCEGGPRGWPSLPAFNDADGRTQQDVIALLEKGRAQAAEAGE